MQDYHNDYEYRIVEHKEGDDIYFYPEKRMIGGDWRPFMGTRIHVASNSNYKGRHLSSVSFPSLVLAQEYIDDFLDKNKIKVHEYNIKDKGKK